MRFNLYAVEILCYEVDETLDSEAKIENKFLLISTPQDSYRNFNNDKFHFDFFRDKTYEKYTTEKVNTKIKLFHSNGKGENILYARINHLNYLKLCWRFQKLWIQKKDNLMWLINLFVAIVSIAFSSYVAISISKENKNQRILIEEIQLQEIIKALESKKEK